MVVRAGTTSRPDLTDGIKRVRQTRTPIVGLVVFAERGARPDVLPAAACDAAADGGSRRHAMTAPRAGLSGLAVLAAPVLLLPLFLRPEAALALSVAGIVAYLAFRSIAYPIALAGIPPIIFGIFADNPLPEGVVSIGLACAILFAIAVAVQRGEAIPPPRVLVGASLVLTLLLLCLLIVREPAAPETNYGSLKTAFFAISNVVFVIGGIFVGWSAERLRLLLLALLAISVAGAVVLVLHVAGGGSQAILPVPLTFSDGDHSISMGRQMAVGVLSRSRSASGAATRPRGSSRSRRCRC